MNGESESDQYIEILVYIMRLRQICCHPSLAKEALEALLSGNGVSRFILSLVFDYAVNS